AIARALVHKPRLLLLDEVTTALDPATERSICETLSALAGQVTIVAISHQTAMRDVADAIVRLEHGRVTVRRSPRHAAAVSHKVRPCRIAATPVPPDTSHSRPLHSGSIAVAAGMER